MGHPLAVTDPNIRRLLQLAGLRFMCRQAMDLGISLKAGTLTPDEIDAKLEALGVLDLVYPEHMTCE